MKKLYLTYCFYSTILIAHAQSVSVTELINYSHYSVNKFENAVERKGFIPQSKENGSVVFAYPIESNEQAKEPVRSITKYIGKETSDVLFEKLSKAEWDELKKNLVEEGFDTDNLDTIEEEIVYQKKNYTVTVFKNVDAMTDKTCYNVHVQTKNLPKAKEVRYAEDLLQLSSHEYLATVYGEANVQKDVYINLDGKRQACSVLFPGTTSEAVFIWNDPKSYRNLYSLHLGGHSYTESSLQYKRPVLQNKWVTRQGFYSGMSLHELDRINGKEISFYGWDWNRGGTLADGNKGNIDFDKVGFILSCLNCNDDAYTGDKVNTSKSALDQNKRIHASTIVLYGSK